MKPRLAKALVRLYPAEWRQEYGAELTDLLVDRPPSMTAVADVIWNAFRLRLCRREPALISASAVFAILASLFVFRTAAFMIFKFTLGPSIGPGGQPVSGWLRWWPLAPALLFAGCAVWGFCTGIGLFRHKGWARVSIQLFGITMMLFILPAESQMWTAPIPEKALRYGLYAAQVLTGAWWPFFFGARKTRQVFTSPNS